MAEHSVLAPSARAAREAEALGRHLPPLQVAAERVAATVAQGLHGRRRVGAGENFWQFRPFVTGDARARIDWRRSARSDRAYLRETELETAQTVCLWRDAGSSMRWRSATALPEKRARAELLLLALGALLARGGERMRLIAPGERIVGGPLAVTRLSQSMAAETEADGDGFPRPAPLPRHARVVLFGDFLSSIGTLTDGIARLAGNPARGHLVQILDPAEALLPFDGRVRFTGLDAGRTEALVPRVAGVRAAYQDRLERQRAALAAACAVAGWTFVSHRTDHPPEPVLLSLFTALST